MSFMRKARRLYPHFRRWLHIASLQAQNVFSSESVTGAGVVVVSLTTYGRRTEFVHLAVESIVRGTVRPGRIILWLDEADAMANPPKALLRLARRGLEIKQCSNYGPHKKYYPYVEALTSGRLPEPLVIVDDDFIYPQDWLQSLLDSYSEYPDSVSCTRAHEFQIDDTARPYSQWPSCRSDRPSFQTFATGVGGVLYPPSVQLAIKSYGTAFEACAPRADDVWLHYVAISNGNKIRQVHPIPLDLEFKILPFGQKTSLQVENVGLAANDKQIANTYDERALDILRDAAARSGA